MLKCFLACSDSLSDKLKFTPGMQSRYPLVPIRRQIPKKPPQKTHTYVFNETALQTTSKWRIYPKTTFSYLHKPWEATKSTVPNKITVWSNWNYRAHPLEIFQPHYCILASSFRGKLPSSKYESKEGNTNSQNKKISFEWALQRFQVSHKKGSSWWESEHNFKHLF